MCKQVRLGVRSSGAGLGAAVLLKAFDSGQQTLFVGVDEENEMFSRIRAFVTAVHERFECTTRCIQLIYSTMKFLFARQFCDTVANSLAPTCRFARCGLTDATSKFNFTPHCTLFKMSKLKKRQDSIKRIAPEMWQPFQDVGWGNAGVVMFHSVELSSMLEKDAMGFYQSKGAHMLYCQISMLKISTH